ncbi:hypothetical protein M3J09_007411 [Ascochyta lentis]
MFGLHTDIELIILDCITTNRDLRALCLTSKACHERAIPRLFRQITIPLWHSSALLFYQQFQPGDKDYLKHTRKLTVVHEEITNPLNGFAPEDKDKPDEDAVKLAGDLGLVVFMAILQLFPTNVLHEFRFVSSRCLPLMALRHLSLKQRLITNLRSSYVDSPLPMNASWPSDLFHFVRHLDLYIDGPPSQLSNCLYGLASTHTPIESLSLTLYLHHDDSEDVQQYLWAAMEESGVERPRPAMPNLRELALSGFDLSLPYLPVLQKFVKFERLTKLQVSNCHQASTFFADLGAITSIERFHLEHIAVDSLNEDPEDGADSEEEDTPIDDCLEQVFQKSGKLQSLHLGWHEHCLDARAVNTIQITLQTLYRDGESLRILSLHPHNETDYEESVNSLGTHLERVCEACPNLEQLGYQLADGTLDSEIGAPNSELSEFVNRIAKLHNLHTLHLRYPHEVSAYPWDPYMCDLEERRGYMKKLSRILQYIASEIFLQLERLGKDTGLRHKLDTIVIGHFTTLRQQSSKCSLPQHCFIKALTAGRRVDMPSDWTSPTDPGIRVFCAELVSRTVLRQLRFHTEILDLDPGVEPFEQWAARAL